MGRFAPSGLTAAILVLSVLALPLCPLLSGATTIVVPDQAPTIQAALNAFADTVVIRPGSYNETPVVFRPVFLTAKSADPVDRPTLSGMLLEPALPAPGYQFGFCNIDFAGLVTIRNEYLHCIIDFRLCRLGSGLKDVSSSDRTWDIHLTKCSIVGSVDLYALASCSVDSCDLTGGIKKVVLSTTHLFVTNNTFHGDGSADAAIRADGQRCQVLGNTIQGYGIGMTLRPEYSGVVSGNVVEDCFAIGVALERTEDAEAVANTVRRCGQGMVIGGRVVVASDNIVENCLVDAGMRVGAGNAIVERNVIWGCEDRGLVVEFLGEGTSRIANNTSCMNRGTGVAFRLNPLVGDAQTEILRNISASNGGWGLLWVNQPQGSVSRLACNDWFGNVSGDVSGAPLSVEDFSVDPLFCSAASGDVHLQAGSPLLDAPGCGLIGARGMGCATTAVLVSVAHAEGFTDRVEVAWEVGGLTGGAVTVHRAELAGDWHSVVTTSPDGVGRVSFTDRDVTPGRRYGYRLGVIEGSQEVLAGETWVDVPALDLALHGAQPNPSGRQLSASITLPDMAPATLELVDLSGRRLLAREVGSLGAGRHLVDMTPDEPLAAGVYWLRLTQGRRTLAAKAALVK